MFTELYIEALLVDEELADLVWEAWARSQITAELAGLTWSLVAATTSVPLLASSGPTGPLFLAP